MQLQLHYSTQHYANYITLRYNYNYNCNYNYTTVHNTRVHYTTLHYTNYTAPQLQLQLQLHYSTLITLHYNYSYNLTTLHYTTTTTTTALRHTTSSSCRWGDHCSHCSHSKQHNSNHLSVHQWIRSAIHASQQLASPIFESSATALCNTTGIIIYHIISSWFLNLYNII